MDVRRYEIKFVFQEHERYRLLKWLEQHPACFIRPYPARRVNSVYFDTLDYFAYRENLAGTSDRTKVRYRWYGQAGYPDAGTLEIKRKRNCYGWKYRYPVGVAPCSEAGWWRKVVKDIKAQIEPKGRYWLDTNPMPMIINRYDRIYFESKCGRLRATVDSNQVMYDQRKSRRPNIHRKLNIPQTGVLELKFSPENYDFASTSIQGIPVRVGRNSKYMTGVKTALLNTI